jgi:nucleoside-diphosphate-sugar epimerase
LIQRYLLKTKPMATKISTASTAETVLVTGGSGFIGMYCILQLLEWGYLVNTTVRSLSREAEVRETLKNNGVDGGDRLTFTEADLTADKGWPEAAAGCTYVLHVASPFPIGVPKDENELTIPAREGALRVLRAAKDAGVKRVVLTSSVAAVAYSEVKKTTAYTEDDWSDPATKIPPYPKSKTLAERAAWNFIEREGNGLELSVVNPVGVFGPVMGSDFSTSIEIVKRLMDGAVPGCPRLSFGIVDVRDVADLHLRAMTDPKARGERFLAVTGKALGMIELSALLKAKLGDAAKKVPTRKLPDWLLKALALIDPELRQVIPELGKVREYSNDKAKKMLGWNPRTREEAVIATAESLLGLGLLKK